MVHSLCESCSPPRSRSRPRAATTTPDHRWGQTPTIAISGSSATLSLVAGTSSTTTFTLTRGGGFTGDVGVAVTGAPTGVTVTLNPTSFTGSTTSATATVTAAATTTPGTYPLTVTATGSGVTTQTATLTLTVTAPAPTPAFTIAVPTGPTIAAGASGTARVNVTRTNFTAGVNLTVEGAPTGVTATVAPNPTSADTAAITLAVASTVAPGTYPLTVRGASTGLTDRTTTFTLTVTAATVTGNYTLTVTPTTLSVPQGGSGSATVNLARTGGFADAVGLAITGAPTGLTATLASASTTGNSVGINLSAASTLAPGTYNLTITGTAAGIANQTATLAVTVTAAPTGSFTIAVSPATVTLPRGGSTTLTVDIARTGGFADPVDITVSGLPAGVTATIAAASSAQLGVRAAALQASRAAAVSAARAVSTRSAALLVPISSSRATVTLTSTSTATTGAFTPTITASAGGITRTASTSTITVTAASTGAIAYQFCDVTNIPIWVAYQDGTGAWTQVTGSSNLYRFDITSGKGGVAIVTPNGSSGFNTIVYYGTKDELTSYGASQCTSGAGGSKRLTGSVAGAGTTGFIPDIVYVGTSGRLATVNSPATTFTLDSVPDGPRDYVAARLTGALSGTSLAFTTAKLILRRDQNYTGTIPTFDFNGSEAFDPERRTVTIGNLGSETSTASTIFVGNSAQGSVGIPISLGVGLSGGATQSFYAVPAARLRSSDLQFLVVSGSPTPSGSSLPANYSQRVAGRFFTTPSDLTLNLGAALTIPTQTTLSGASYLRYRVTAPVQAEYANIYLASWTQTSGTGRAVTVYQTNGYTGGAAWDLSIPDFTGAAGFNATWMLQSSGGAVGTIFTGTGYDFASSVPGAAVAGGTLRSGTRTTLPGSSILAPSARSPQSMLQLQKLSLPKVFVRPERLTGRMR